MGSIRQRRPSHSTVIAYLAFFVALGGGAYAATSGSFVGTNGAIHGCVPKKGGPLTVFKPGHKCSKGTVSVSFNQQGSLGPPGATGQTGATGAQGSPGNTGSTGPIGPSAAAVHTDLGNPPASPNETGFAITKTITLPTASRLLVYASGQYGFNCAGPCADHAGLYVDNVPVPGTELDFSGNPPPTQFVQAMGITSTTLPAGTHTVTWTDNGDGNVLQSGPVNSTGIVAAIATG